MQMLEDKIHGLVLGHHELSREFPENQTIAWPSGNSLEIRKRRTYGYTLIYRFGNEEINLNELVHRKTDFWFTMDPSEAFLYQGPSLMYQGRPEIRLVFDSLREDEGRILEVLHEIGHDISIRKKAGKVHINDGEAAIYGTDINSSNPTSNEEKSEERQAWAHALRILRRYSINLPGLERNSAIIKRVSSHLEGYGAKFSYKPNA